MARHLFSFALIQLTTLVGEVLGGPAAPKITLTEPLLRLGWRHQVSAMLYAVAVRGRHAMEEGVIESLVEHYQASAARQKATLAVLDRIAASFDRLDLNWMVFKGVTQAAQLYPDPAWRDSADIDLLVPPAQFDRALDGLVEIGFVASYPPVPKHGILRSIILAAVRDVMLVMPKNTAHSVELHKRLFFARGRHADFLTLPATEGPMPTPQLGPDLAFYLIAHGAASYWVRLKWLIDLVPLLGQLRGEELLAIRARAHAARSGRAVAASLILLRSLFPFVDLGPLENWLDEMGRDRAVAKRLHRYAKALNGEEETGRSPLNHAWTMLQAAMLLFEAPSTRLRILLAAPFSSFMRRLAGRIYPEARALTLS